MIADATNRRESHPANLHWLNAVKADGGLRASCFKVAFQLAQKTSSAEFSKSGVLVSWQAQKTIAGAIGMSERTVREMVHLLREAGYLAIKTGHGPGLANRYTLILQERQSAASFVNPKSGNPLPHSGSQKRHHSLAMAAVCSTNGGNELPPN